MNEVSKSEFERLYLQYGSQCGYGKAQWDALFSDGKAVSMRLMVKAPESPAHCRMMIVSDWGAREHRMAFLTVDQEERLFGR